MKKLLLFALLSLSTIVRAQKICIEGTYQILSIECLDYYRQANWANTWYGAKLKFKTSEDRQTIDMSAIVEGQKNIYRFKYINGRYTLIGEYGTVVALSFKDSQGCLFYNACIEICEKGKETVCMWFKPLEESPF